MALNQEISIENVLISLFRGYCQVNEIEGSLWMLRGMAQKMLRALYCLYIIVQDWEEPYSGLNFSSFWQNKQITVQYVCCLIDEPIEKYELLVGKISASTLFGVFICFL